MASNRDITTSHQLHAPPLGDRKCKVGFARWCSGYLFQEIWVTVLSNTIRNSGMSMNWKCYCKMAEWNENKKSYPGANKLAQPGMNLGSLENSMIANMQKKKKIACSANLKWKEMRLKCWCAKGVDPSWDKDPAPAAAPWLRSEADFLKPATVPHWDRL